MAIVFKTPKSALNTTTKTIQNLGNGECPPCPDCPEVKLETADVNYTENGEYTLTPEGDGFSKVDISVNIDTQSIADAAYDEGYSEGIEEQKGKLTSLDVTANGSYNSEDGYSEVTVNVQPNLQTKDFTLTGTLAIPITADSGYDGIESGAIYVSKNVRGSAANPATNEMEATGGVFGNYDGVYALLDTADASSITKSGNNWVVAFEGDGNWEDYTFVIVPPTGGFPNGFTITSGDELIVAIPQNLSSSTNVTLYSYNGIVDKSSWVPVVINNQNKTVSPSTSQQTVTADSGYSGLGTVTVNAVTAAIDANIVAENILDGVTILGVTGEVVEASFEPNKEFYGDVTGVYMVTPQSGYNGFDEVQVTVENNPIGSFWNPFEVSDNVIMADVYNKLDEGGYFDYRSALFGMGVESGSIDSETGYYIAEDANGNSFTIEPYFENPDYNPELSPEDQPDVPALIFPENFDLSGLNIQVEAGFDSVTITENEPEDPMLEPTYTTEIVLGTLCGINWNSDMESWPLYWGGGLSGGIETSTRNLHLSTNVAQTMSIASPEAWEIELDEPTQTRSTMGLLKAAPQPTLEIDKMSGNAGVFTLNILSTSDQATGFTVRGLNSGNEVYVEVNSVGNYFTIESLEDDNEITISYNTSSQSDTDPNPFDIEYSVDGGDTWETPTWSSLTGASDFTVELEATGDTIMFKGNNDALYLSKPNSQSCYLRFASTKTVDIYGNICSMLSKTDFNNYILETSSAFFNLFYGGNLKIVNAENLIMPSVLSTRCFSYMFRDCTLLESAPALPAGSVPQEAYQGMFQGCTSLVTAPELPAKILGTYCYSSMFYRCSSLENVPIINVKELKMMCFNLMFSGCTSITSIPDGSMYGASGKTAANNSCSSMFNGCTSLEYVPSDLLQSSYAGTDCYSAMFQGCTNLTTAPYLPALVDGTVSSTRSYRYMFKNCTSLTASPVIASPSGYLNSFEEMFAGCTSLEEVTCLVKTSGGSFTNFLSGASETGTLYKDPESSIDWTSIVPTGWTIEDYVEPSN